LERAEQIAKAGLHPLISLTDLLLRFGLF